jgi:2-polyprenyl-6-methoxyphenol hydroxylase-like FAD-dependent oxidoreductase
VDAVDLEHGTVALDSAADAGPQPFDFIIGGDGAGSVVRKAMSRQVPGFTVETRSYPNYCTMIELDRVGGDMDPHYLHGLYVRPFCVAGAIPPDAGSRTPRWFCAIGTRAKQTFASADEARRFFRERAPRVLALTTDEKVAAFAERTCYHIGNTLACSQLHGGKAVLLGDAAAAFPPIGQGVNAAMESAMVLDRCIGETGASAPELLEAAQRYNAKWRPEAEAVAWMAVRSLFENRAHMLRAQPLRHDSASASSTRRRALRFPIPKYAEEQSGSGLFGLGNERERSLAAPANSFNQLQTMRVTLRLTP